MTAKPEDWQQAIKQVEAGMNMIEQTSMWRAQAAMYRDQLVDGQGFSKEAAEAMAVQYHGLCMAIIAPKIVEQQKGGG